MDKIYVLNNGKVWVQLDTTYPQVMSYYLAESDGTLNGGCSEHGSIIKINGAPYTAEIEFKPISDTKAEYYISVKGVTLGDKLTEISFISAIYLEENRVCKTIYSVEGDFEDCGLELTFTTPILVTADEKESIAVSKFNIEKGFEYIGTAENSDAFCQDECSFAFMWNTSVAAGLYTPSATHRPYIAEVTEEKTAKFFEGTYYHRFIDGHRAAKETPDGVITETDYKIMVGLVSDVNNNNIVDWQDAALWLRTVIPQLPEDLKNMFKYGNWRQLHLAFPKAGGDFHTNPVFTVVYSTMVQLLQMQKQIFALTDGTVNCSYETVGWQGRGHDYGWPDLSEQPFNPAIGDVEYFKSFRERLAEYGADLSFHINQTDISDITSCLYRRGSAPSPFGNFLVKAEQVSYPHRTFGWTGFSISHYADFRKGYSRNRQDAFVEKYFAPFAMYTDVMVDRPSLGFRGVEEKYAKARNIQHWEALGTHMATEYYKPEKFLNGQFMFNCYKYPNVIDEFVTACLIQRGSFIRTQEDRIFGNTRYGADGQANWYLDGNFRAEAFARMIYMSSLYNGFLRDQGIRYFEETETEKRVYYGKNTCITYDKETDTYVTFMGDTFIADCQTRIVPEADNAHRCFVYSSNPINLEWVLPEMWQDCAEIYLYRVTVNGKRKPQRLAVKNGRVSLNIPCDKYKFYILSDILLENNMAEEPDYAKEAELTASCSVYVEGEEMIVAPGMDRLMIPASASPDGDWRKTIMMSNDIMADDEGNIYYYYPCCQRCVTDGDKDTAWRVTFDGQNSAWINFDFRDDVFDISSISIDFKCKAPDLRVKVIGVSGGKETELYCGTDLDISVDGKAISQIKIMLLSETKESTYVRNISIH
ncbi:MAG: hypothetical protein IKD04_05980 [Clostridia bacterium]|nr:hypothetical protein [Clostridia bacterium]